MHKERTESLLFIRPKVFQPFERLIAAESTRIGGVSLPPFDQLNLGLSTDDNPDSVVENRQRFFSALGLSENQTASAYQVHGDAILEVTTPGRWEGYDALVTNQPGIFLNVTTADCTPILLFDPVNHVVAAVHAGWRGTSLYILRKTLDFIHQRYGTIPAHCVAFIGTCIDECSYEVHADVADHFQEAFKRWDSEKQKFFLDLKKANQYQLLEAGVPEKNIEISPYSTITHNARFFSYRKENGKTGRMLNVIGLTQARI